uniref:Uncharacterized protein n=1 Tax=Strigamia maritima TaxID=126957 RepID=T1J0W2_STRMM
MRPPSTGPSVLLRRDAGDQTRPEIFKFPLKNDFWEKRLDAVSVRATLDNDCCEAFVYLAEGGFAGKPTVLPLGFIWGQIRYLAMGKDDGKESKATGIKQLGKHNYITWKRDIQLLLEENDLFVFTDESGTAKEPLAATTEEAKAKYAKRKLRSRAILINSVSEEFRDAAVKHPTTKLVWEHLKQVFEPSSRSRKAKLREDFCLIQRKNGESMSTFIDRIDTAGKEVEALKMTASEERTYTLINRVGDGFDSLRQIIDRHILFVVIVLLPYQVYVRVTLSIWIPHAQIMFARILAYAKLNPQHGLYELIGKARLAPVRSNLNVTDSRVECANNVSSNLSIKGEQHYLDLVNLWHRRLGHQYSRGLNHLMNDSQVKGIEIPKRVEQLNCEACKIAKSKRSTYQNKESGISVNEPLGLLHMDLWGPSSIESLGGSKFLFCIVDDATRYTWVYPLKAKSDAYVTDLQLKHLKVPGSLAYVHVPAPKRDTKHSARAWKGIVVGYAMSTRGYRVWDPSTDEVMESKHVEVDESRNYSQFDSVDATVKSIAKSDQDREDVFYDAETYSDSGSDDDSVKGMGIL